MRDGHLAIAFVGEDEIRSLNAAHRSKDGPTDVLEAVVHGVLHLCGYDHEADGGEMLALQQRVLDELT